MDHICFRKDYFIAFVVVAVALIIWVLYQAYDKLYTVTRISKMLQMEPEHHSPPQEEEKARQQLSPSPMVPPPVSLPPEALLPRSYPMVTYRSHRSPYDPAYGNYQLVGYVYPERHPDQMFRLMGRQFTSARFEYYVVHPLTEIKIPIHHKNDWELNTGDRISIPGFKGHYTVFIYDMDRVIF